MHLAMGPLVLSLAALAALVPFVPPSTSVGASGSYHAERSPGGAVASATITVRIIASSVRLGAGQPPLPDRTPRSATIAAADGSPVPALIYDFE